MLVTIPLRTGRGLNAREHHMARHRRVKAERAMVGWLLPRSRPALPCHCTLTRVSPPQGRPLDGDNLQGSLKAVRDAVAEWLGIDDGGPMVHWDYAQAKGDWAVRIDFLGV